MKKFIYFAFFMAFFSLVIFCIPPCEVAADGDETLGDPSIDIASGSDILVAGTGLLTQPGNIIIDVPMGVTIKQVLLYWHGYYSQNDAMETNTITVNGSPITGSLIGTGYTDRFCYRADITANGLLNLGPNNLTVGGLDFDINNGAGLLVIIDDGVNTSEIDIRDGDDFAFQPWNPPYDTTVVQTFDFFPEDFDRVATISMFFASVSGTASGGNFRPTAIMVTVGGSTTVYNDELDSKDGQEWDTLTLAVDIPAQADSLTIQALSVDNPEGETGTPASFDWLTAALSVPAPSGGEGCTPGYWKQKQHFFAWEGGYTPETPFSAVFEDAFPGMTLLEVLKQGGGGLNALGRHVVAALLNASSTNTNYDLSKDDIIFFFNDVYPGSKADYNLQKDIFQSFNEQGCPLGNNNDSTGNDANSGPASKVTDSISTDGPSSGNSGCFISDLFD